MIGVVSQLMGIFKKPYEAPRLNAYPGTKADM
jgi:hypothetical protein